MKDRIIRIMHEEKMNASQFSEAIGIQRAAISHILAGRNNPSLDMIKKILTKFTTISPDWLLSGEGEMRRAQGAPHLSAADTKYDLFSQSSQPDGQAHPQQIHRSGTRDVRNPGSNLRMEANPVGNSPHPGAIRTETQFTDVNNKKGGVYIDKQEANESIRETIVYKEHPEKMIDKLMIFYSDNTFESFIPEKHYDNRK